MRPNQLPLLAKCLETISDAGSLVSGFQNLGRMLHCPRLRARRTTLLLFWDWL